MTCRSPRMFNLEGQEQNNSTLWERVGLKKAQEWMVRNWDKLLGRTVVDQVHIDASGTAAQSSARRWISHNITNLRDRLQRIWDDLFGKETPTTAPSTPRGPPVKNTITYLDVTSLEESLGSQKCSSK
ncbi:hypothetical protein L596_000328 [Steinernema carpocapsae]|uniref:Uncharacterized protein n=1 Tax=Steinernema carpocapsae TaxID=34508 RepID=A0A4U8UM13_STECR|nr:hypothetical protein L596_000328 [Steinernema carpocapsae]